MRDIPEKSIVSAEEKERQTKHSHMTYKGLREFTSSVWSDTHTLTLVLQVLLACLCGGHHVGCHLVHMARSLLESCQFRTIAVCLYLNAEGEREKKENSDRDTL